MADLKISQLPAATTPLAGTEVLPIVQSGTTVQASVDSVIASRASLAANTFTAAQEWATGTAIASASTINLNTATGNRVHITGTTAITAVTLTRGPRTVIFDGVLTLTHNATTNNLPGGANITTAAGDRAIYESDGTTVYCVSYIKVSGAAVVAPAAGFTLGTPVASTSGTSIDFTGIPATAKSIVINFLNVSTTGSDTLFIQLGTSSGVESSGYLSDSFFFISSPSIAGPASSTSAFVLSAFGGGTSSRVQGAITLSMLSSSANSWTCNAMLNDSANVRLMIGSGSKALAGVLDRVRITTSGGSQTFDNGEINIAYI
jgi:hypothetical protein